MNETDTEASELADELRALRVEVTRISSHRYIRAHDSLLGLFAFNFVRGLAVGLGTVVGATILVSIAVFLLSQIDFVPIIGDWATLIVNEITHENTEAVP